MWDFSNSSMLFSDSRYEFDGSAPPTGEAQRLVTLGTIAGGETIAADVTQLGPATQVTLLTPYTFASPRPAGFPIRPSFTGVAAGAMLDVAGEVFPSGTVLEVLACEATALVNAGAAAVIP